MGTVNWNIRDNYVARCYESNNEYEVHDVIERWVETHESRNSGKSCRVIPWGDDGVEIEVLEDVDCAGWENKDNYDDLLFEWETEHRSEVNALIKGWFN